MAFELTAKQQEANRLLGSPATHTMLYGGARSGKTFLIVRAQVTRRLAHKSKGAILRYRFNHLKGSIIYDTLPKVMELCFPGVAQHCHMDKSDWFYRFPNESEIWFGGLDEKERTEKILGQEYCVDPNAKVLTADLQWVAAQDLSVGREIIGFPEQLFGHQILQRSVVERNDLIEADRFKIVTDRGETIVSANHLFVNGRPKSRNRLQWIKAQELRTGHYIKHTVSPWLNDDSREAGWMGDILDGEGCITKTKTYGNCVIAQNDGAVQTSIVNVLSKWGVAFGVHGTKRCKSIVCKGMWAALRLLGRARSERLLAKSSVLWEGCRPFNGHGDNFYAKVLHVENLGRGPVIALGTSTKTFIADGFLGHNSDIFLNECSQIPWASRNIAMTRLAQNSPLRLRAWYDCNPPSESHWTNRVFVSKTDPDTRTPLRDPDNFTSMVMNPRDNAVNLPATYIKELEDLPERMRRRFLLGQFGTSAAGALWSLESLDMGRVLDGAVPEMQRIVIAVDPSGCSGPEDTRSDEVGIIVAGLGTDGRGYVLEDLSGRFGPHQWGKIVATAFDRHSADAVVAEINFGGAMVGEVIRAARLETKGPKIPFRTVTASRGKVVRAEPIAALYGTEEHVGKVSHVGNFALLEDQLCGFTTAGYIGDRSPDRADAMIWALAELFPMISRTEKKKPLALRPPLELEPVQGGQGWMRT